MHERCEAHRSFWSPVVKSDIAALAFDVSATTSPPNDMRWEDRRVVAILRVVDQTDQLQVAFGDTEPFECFVNERAVRQVAE